MEGALFRTISDAEALQSGISYPNKHGALEAAN